MSPHFLSHPVKKAVLRIYENLGTPTSLKMKILVENEEWDQVVSQKLDPKHYLDAESYWRDANAINILKKMVDLPTSYDLSGNAKMVFRDCERQCFRANLRLLPYLSPGLPGTEEGVVSYIKRCRKIVSRILGPCPDTSSRGFYGRHGPGATFADKGKLSTVPDKMSSRPTLTNDAWPFHFSWSGTLWASACAASGRDVLFVPGNRFTTVPKDGEKDRGIAIEPSINVFYQLGYGRVIRDRLKRAGINLADGQDIHRQVACEASIRGHLATLDLSNASDTICSNLVKLLLPSDWFSVLNDLRSRKTFFEGRWHVLEKFSSMGNGFTFELETLIFLGLALALPHPDLSPGRNVFVYGDDIIVPTDAFKDLVSVLNFFGMSVNRKKSFFEGPFRESCGGDYFNGVDVRPLQLKSQPDTPEKLISFANGLRRISSSPERWKLMSTSWMLILDQLPSDIRRLRGPSALGDICIHDPRESLWVTTHRDEIRYVRCYSPARYHTVSWRNFKPDVILASALCGVPWNNGEIIPRDSVAGYSKSWVAYS